MKDGSLAKQCVSAFTARGQKLLGHYKHSNLSCKTLQKGSRAAIGCPKHRLIQDESTRWFHMLEQLVQQRKAITAASAQVELHALYWAPAEKVVTLANLLVKQVVIMLLLVLLFQL